MLPICPLGSFSQMILLTGISITLLPPHIIYAIPVFPQTFDTIPVPPQRMQTSPGSFQKDSFPMHQETFRESSSPWPDAQNTQDGFGGGGGSGLDIGPSQNGIGLGGGGGAGMNKDKSGKGFGAGGGGGLGSHVTQLVRANGGGGLGGGFGP
ncbi:MAG: hypothetical protein DHS80DRAFT_23380 [Piptocephalis tieghemiana]|nr:MAG: hypothetical protein DHS80DRAFT_23380 [Piptocephalis tieghemiana]